MTADVQDARGSTPGVWSLAWSPDMRDLAVAGSREVAFTCDPVTAGLRTLLTGHSAQVNAVAWSPDGRYLATASDDRTAGIWDAFSGARLTTLEGHSGWVNDVAWSADGTRVATSSADKTAVIWEATTWAALISLTGHEDRVLSIAWAPDGTRLATTSDDGAAVMWDARTGQFLSRLEGQDGRMLSVAWAPDGTRLATLSENGTVGIWGSDTGSLLTRLAYARLSGWVRSLGWSPDGTRLAGTSGDGSAVIWDAATGAPIATVGRRGASLVSLAWSPDGTLLATGDAGGEVQVWDPGSGVPLVTFAAASLTGPATVFISHAGAEPSARVFVQDMVRRLRDWGVGPWLDLDRSEQRNRRGQALGQAIERCDAAIVVVTDQYLGNAVTADERRLLRARWRREPTGAFPVLRILGPGLDPARLAAARDWTDLATLADETLVLGSFRAGELDRLRPWVDAVLERTRSRTTSRPEERVVDQSAEERRDPAARLRAKQGSIEVVAGDIPINGIADGRALVVPEDGPLPVFGLPGGGRVTLLSPDLRALRRVAATWRRELQRAGAPVPDEAGTAADDAPPAAGSAAERLGGDGAAVNGSSLAFLVEYEGTSCLITGDAHPARLERSLRLLLRERSVERLQIDLMVLPHNSSRMSMTPALLGLLDCDRFVVATNGAYFGHPDDEVIGLLGRNRPEPATVYFNYRSVTTEPYADEEQQRRLNIVAVFPEDGRPSTILLPRAQGSL